MKSSTKKLQNVARVMNFFFMSEISHKNAKVLPLKSDPRKVTEHQFHKQNMIKSMKSRYPEIYSRHFFGKVAYTLRPETPEEVVRNGGFYNSESVWLSNTGSGENKGSICLSLLPEVTTIFNRYKKSTVYAIPLWGEFLCPGGPWRQVISPGALPLPPFWIARDVIKSTVDNKVILGPIIVPSLSMPLLRGERLDDYLGSQLIKPQEIDHGEDYSYFYEIIDTFWTQKFQEEVRTHYAESTRSSFRR